MFYSSDEIVDKPDNFDEIMDKYPELQKMAKEKSTTEDDLRNFFFKNAPVCHDLPPNESIDLFDVIEYLSFEIETKRVDDLYSD